MTIPQSRRLQIRSIGAVRKTSSGNSYVECETDSGLVAFWGDAASMANIQSVVGRATPFFATCGCIPSNWEQHAFWIPQAAEVAVEPFRS